MCASVEGMFVPNILRRLEMVPGNEVGREVRDGIKIVFEGA